MFMFKTEVFDITKLRCFLLPRRRVPLNFFQQEYNLPLKTLNDGAKPLIDHAQKKYFVRTWLYFASFSYYSTFL